MNLNTALDTELSKVTNLKLINIPGMGVTHEYGFAGPEVTEERLAQLIVAVISRQIGTDNKAVIHLPDVKVDTTNHRISFKYTLVVLGSNGQYQLQ